ncbi:MAG: hypothetical protein KC657_20635 [Myxococcales bacterium]|nr:hypothetical protein [Myxococcales bacterium]
MSSKFTWWVGPVMAVTVAACAGQTDDGPGEATSEAALTQEDEAALTAIREAVKDVDQEKVTFAEGVRAPSASAGSGARGDGTSLYGVDWFQKWDGGVNANHDWSKGTENGKRCMWAAVARFEAIMKEAPPELKAFLAEYTKWSGSFYNWVDDYNDPEAYGDARGARLWAWRTGLSKWISAAAKDGSCYLPTRKMVVDYAKACKDYAASHDGEMQGCQASR